MNLEKINKDDLEQLFSLLNKMLGEEDNEKLGKKKKGMDTRNRRRILDIFPARRSNQIFL